jgi:hypothetical protein
LPVTQLGFQNYSPDLFDLIRLRLGTAPLQIDLLIHAGPAEQMVAAAHSLFEPQSFQQMTQVVKSNGRIGGPVQDPLKDLVYGHKDILLGDCPTLLRQLTDNALLADVPILSGVRQFQS